ncbi:MAG: hypothetical protein CMH54_01300 [Myxococcales bacterium]|nr:hypothetical protein [Myxococcales bacterium]
MYRTRLLFISLLLSVLVVGCSGSSGDTANNDKVVDIPGDDSRLASDLTPSEAMALCEQAMGGTQAAFGDGNFMCVMQGLSIEQAGFGDCDEVVAECVAAGESALTPDEDPCVEAHDDFVGCTATVAELEDCLNETYALLAETYGPYSDISCDSDPSVLAEIQSIGEPAQAPCMEEIEAKCPGLGSSGDGGDVPPRDIDIDFAGDDTRLMSDLTAEEWEGYCQQTADAMNAEISELDVCMLQAIFMSQEGRGPCEQIYASCMEDEPPSQTIDADCDELELTTCQATLAQVESCANDLVESMRVFAEPALDADCSTDPSLLGDGSPPDPPCVFEIDAICPGFGPSDN